VNQARADVAQATAQSAQQNVRIAGENHDVHGSRPDPPARTRAARRGTSQ
jgi:hypothetical protein